MPELPSRRVVIVGGGPAGFATALALRQCLPGGEITVLCPPAPRSRRRTETFPPTLEPLLKRLGVWDDFRRDGHRPCFGSAASWGHDAVAENDFVFHPYTRGWHVDRPRFDRTLAEIAAKEGIEVLAAHLAGPLVRNRRGGWSLACASREAEAVSLEADWVVDASGRSAVVARRLGARLERTDRLVGVARPFVIPRSHVDGQGDTRSFVEATESGWWSSSWSPDGVAWVAFMTDDDLARAGHLGEPESWDRAFRGTRHLRHRLAGAEPRGNPCVQAAHSGLSNPVVGDRWLAVGDAASCLDPLSSMGVFKAFRSGILASFALRNAFDGDGAGMVRYQALHRAEYNHYLEGRARFYADEGRWPDSEFWRRRRPEPIVTPDSLGSGFARGPRRTPPSRTPLGPPGPHSDRSGPIPEPASTRAAGIVTRT